MPRVTNKLLRQISRHLSSEDVLSDMTALASLFREKPDIFGSYLPIVEGFSSFIDSIQDSYIQYEDKNKMAIRNLQLSSNELNTVNRKLEFLNSSMNAMLESLGPGLLFFDKTGMCSSVFSRSCKDYLEMDPGGRYIWDVLNLQAKESENFKNLMQYVFENNSAMSFDDLMTMAPQIKIHSDERKLNIEYRLMKGTNVSTHGVLVIITDKSAEENAKKLIEEKEEEAEYILRLSKNRNGFQRFVNDISAYFLVGDKSGYLQEESIETILRTIHTFKGLCGTFFAEELGTFFHDLEDKLSISGKSLEEVIGIIKMNEEKISLCYRDVVLKAKQYFGDNFLLQGETKTLSVDKCREFYNFLVSYKESSHFAQMFLKEFLTIPIWDSIEPLNYTLLEISQRMGKKILPIVFEGENFSILQEPYQNFINSLVHVIRNIVDHGIEAEDVRVLSGKSDFGKVTCRTELIRDEKLSIRLIIEDDGVGIDPNNIMRILQKKGLSVNTDNHHLLIQNIFHPGFSTRNSVSQISGRGVGLYAVYEEVKSLGGDIFVESTPGLGTKFIIMLPEITTL